MSQLDDELAQAAGPPDAVSALPALRPVRAPAPPRRSIGLLVALCVMGGAILTLVLTGLQNGTVYSKGVDELLAEKARLSTRTVRVEGVLVKGSLVHRAEPCEYRFKLQKNGATVDVAYPQCIVPDTFRDVPGMDVQVTAEGKLAANGHFEASTIMAKCPSKYEMQDRAAKGESSPHGAPGAQQL